MWESEDYKCNHRSQFSITLMSDASPKLDLFYVTTITEVRTFLYLNNHLQH